MSFGMPTSSCMGPFPADGFPVTNSLGHHAPARRVRSSASSAGAGSSVTLVFWLGAPHRGKGLMTEAVVAVTDWLASEFDLTEITSECIAGNAASISVARKSGFEFTVERPIALKFITARIPTRGTGCCGWQHLVSSIPDGRCNHTGEAPCPVPQWRATPAGMPHLMTRTPRTGQTSRRPHPVR